MGDVAIKYRLMPEGVETDWQSIEEKIPAAIPGHVRIVRTEVVPLAFGLKSMSLLVVLDDKKGGADDIEDGLLGIDGIQNVEVEEQSLV